MTQRNLIRILAMFLGLALIAAACGSDDSGDDAGGEGGGESEGGVLGVPGDYDTIQAAVDAAEPGDLVLIDEGTYNEGVVVQTDEIVIRGVNRNTVILDGEHGEGMENGIIVFSDGVAVENLTVMNYTGNGVFFSGDYGADHFLSGYRASYVTSLNAGVYGIYARTALNGQFDNSYSSGSDDASYYVGECEDCNALLDNVVGENSQLGYSGTNSSGVTVVNSEFMNNLVGIVPSSADFEALPPNKDTVMVGNYVHDNNNRDVPYSNEAYLVALGSGIIMAGTVDNVAERNLVVDNDLSGIMILGWIAEVFGGETDYPAEGNRVVDNISEGSTFDADLLLIPNSDDNLTAAAGNCFSGNTFQTSRPENVEEQVPCDGEGDVQLTPLTDLLELLNFETWESPDYRDVPKPELNFESMPDATTAPAVPATPDNVPMEVDLDAITMPEKP